jgi:hypothetical protein
VEVEALLQQSAEQQSIAEANAMERDDSHLYPAIPRGHW